MNRTLRFLPVTVLCLLQIEGSLLKYYMKPAYNQKVYYEGERYENDRLDYSVQVKRGSIDSFTWKKYVHYPHEYNRGYNISCIEIISSSTNEDDGHVTLVTGGVGHRIAVILLMSTEGKGMNYRVNIFTINRNG